MPLKSKTKTVSLEGDVGLWKDFLERQRGDILEWKMIPVLILVSFLVCIVTTMLCYGLNHRTLVEQSKQILSLEQRLFELEMKAGK